MLSMVLLLTAGSHRVIVAQSIGGGQIQGTVSDPSGAALAGATVEVVQQESGLRRSTVTGPGGSYALPNLPVGPYSITVTDQGFAPYQQNGIVIQVGNNLEINAKLSMGNVSQTVQVNSGAPMVQTNETSISQVIDRQKTVDLPLNGRQATQLILLSGAATTAPAGDLATSKNYPSAVTISVAGGQGNGINYLLDGADNNDAFSNVNLPFPFPDALQEFSVQTTGLSAQYGLHPGAVVNIVSKSGTNRVHGTLFEFLRNGDFNARNYFAATHDNLKRSQFGGTIGGPIVSNRLFFFGGYQGTRTRTQPPQTISFVPTQAMLQGDFSVFDSATCQTNGKAKTLINPATGQPFPGNKIPASSLNASSLALLKYVPVASDPCGKVTYGIPNPSNEDQYIGRVDWNVSDNQTLFGRYYFTHYNAPAFFNNNLLLTAQPGLDDQVQSATIGDTYSITPTLINSLHVSGTRSSVDRGPNSKMINPNDVGIQTYAPLPHFMQITVSGDFGFGCGTCANTHITTNSLNLVDDMNWSKGKHQISFGGNWIYHTLAANGTNNANGQFVFNGVFTTDALADFMLGDLQQLYQGNVSGGDFRQNYIGAYFQDNIHLFPRLTINAGLRWEPFLPTVETTGRGVSFSRSSFDTNTPSKVFPTAPAGLLFYGDKGIPHGYYKSHYADFEPRIGFAFDPTGNGTSSIRGSYTIGFETPNLYYESHFAVNAPWGPSVTLLSPGGGLTNPYRDYPGGNPFPKPFPPTASNAFFPVDGSYNVFPVDQQPSYMQQWNLSIEKSFAQNWVVSANYIGNRTLHIWAGNELNPAVYIPGKCGSAACSTSANTNSRRVLYLQNPTVGQYYSSVTSNYNGAGESYNGLLINLQHRFADHFTLLTNYTYSHCLAGAVYTGDQGAGVFQNPADPNADYSNCAFDIRHNFVTSLVAKSSANGGRLRRAALSNWQVAPIVSVHSGTPLTPLSGTDRSLTGVGNDRPNVAGDPYAHGSKLQILNASSFTFNGPGQYGDSRPYSLYGPDYFNIDGALTKFVTLPESLQMEVRAECFNCFNHTNFKNPGASLNSQTFGKILSANDPRIIQLSLKLNF